MATRGMCVWRVCTAGTSPNRPFIRLLPHLDAPLQALVAALCLALGTCARAGDAGTAADLVARAAAAMHAAQNAAALADAAAVAQSADEAGEAALAAMGALAATDDVRAAAAQAAATQPAPPSQALAAADAAAALARAALVTASNVPVTDADALSRARAWGKWGTGAPSGAGEARTGEKAARGITPASDIPTSPGVAGLNADFVRVDGGTFLVGSKR